MKVDLRKANKQEMVETVDVKTIQSVGPKNKANMRKTDQLATHERTRKTQESRIWQIDKKVLEDTRI